MPLLVNREELAVYLGRSPRTIGTLLRRGLPVVQRGNKGRPWKFDLVEVRRWELEQEAAKRTAPASRDPKQRLAEISLERAELELAQERGELVPIADVERVWRELFEDLGKRFKALPPRLASNVVGRKRRSIEGVIRKAISGALAGLDSPARGTNGRTRGTPGGARARAPRA